MSKPNFVLNMPVNWLRFSGNSERNYRNIHTVVVCNNLLNCLGGINSFAHIRSSGISYNKTTIYAPSKLPISCSESSLTGRNENNNEEITTILLHSLGRYPQEYFSR